MHAENRPYVKKREQKQIEKDNYLALANFDKGSYHESKYMQIGIQLIPHAFEKFP